MKTRFEIQSRAKEIKKIIEKIILELEKYIKAEQELKLKIEIALREMLANAIEHGCSTRNQTIKIKLLLEKKQLSIKVSDPGKGFHYVDRDLKTMPLLQERGRGLIMINKMVDCLEFNEKGNSITVSFNLQDRNLG